MKALHDLVQSGKVRYIGASSMRCWQFAMLNDVAVRNGWTMFVSMQDEYSLLYREEVCPEKSQCLPSSSTFRLGTRDARLL
jgi:aryl-alcohol dehydrogenase-like predicted oxidoreductase